jgi:small subunit ribosomal protein S6
MIKLIADKAAKKYEFTYLLPEFYTSAEVAKVTTEIEELVKKAKGKVVSIEDWGKKPLAYKIHKGSKAHADALFTHVVIEMEAKNAQKFERDVYLNEKILRHLMVVEEKPSTALVEKTFEKEKAPEKEKETQE